MNINKKILIDYINKTSEKGKNVIIEDVDVLKIINDGLKTNNIFSLYVTVHFNNMGKKNTKFLRLNYLDFVEYCNKLRIDKINKIKDGIQ